MLEGTLATAPDSMAAYATIDQIRLRRAIVLPVAFQNASSSGRQSEIQAGFRVGFVVIEYPFQAHRCVVAGSASVQGGALRGSIPGGEFAREHDTAGLAGA